jgi:hypothetical protein
VQGAVSDVDAFQSKVNLAISPYKFTTGLSLSVILGVSQVFHKEMELDAKF